MSYTPTNWKSGDKVTSTGLNNLEQGVNGLTDELDELYQQINGSAEESEDVTQTVIWQDGKHVDSTTGNILSMYDNYSAAEIPLNGATHISGHTRGGETLTGLAFMNKNKSYISGNVCSTPYDWYYDYDVPDGAAYLRISCNTSRLSTFTCILSKKSSKGLAEDVTNIKQNTDTARIDALVAKMYNKGSSNILHELRPCILVAGQSNVEGKVPISDLPSTIQFPLNNIKVGQDDGTFSNSLNETSNWDITTSLFAKLNDIGDNFYMIKHAKGGSSISEYGGDVPFYWTPFYENIGSDLSKSLLLAFDKKVKKCGKVNPELYDIRAFVWQQGEGDRATRSVKAAQDYYINFKSLIAYIRGMAKNECLPVICGTVSKISGQYDKTVEDAVLQITSEDPYVTCIDMSGAGLLSDGLHFNADSAVYFGHKAYDALIDFGVITGTKINPTRPW